MSYSNGRLPRSVLGYIGNGYFLRKDAARAFLQMSAESKARFGVVISIVAAYRTYAKQVYLWNLYLAGKGNLAARPGTSNHGFGLAIDLASLRMRHIIDVIGTRYGWSKSWSDAQSEWWHIVFDPSHYNPPKPKDPLSVEERRWVNEYIKLKRANKNRKRRTELRKVIKQHRKEVYKYAKKHGWTVNLKRRFRLLQKYS